MITLILLSILIHINITHEIYKYYITCLFISTLDRADFPSTFKNILPNFTVNHHS